MTKTKNHSMKLRNTRRKYWWQSVSVFKVNVLLLALWILACIVYVATLNDMTVKGYKTKKLQNQLLELTSGNKDLNLSLSDKQSMEMITEKVKALGMVPSNSVKYVTMPSTAVVKK